MVFSFDDSVKTVAKLKVVGVGGAGGNAINRMVSSGLQGVEFIAVNTDLMALNHNLSDSKIQIGTKLTGGLGAGANPQVGQMSMDEDRERVRAELEGADMVFIAAGMGGGTGTGAAPVVAEIAREMGILTVAVVTRPFLWEGHVREKNANAGLDLLRQYVDTVIVVPNQKLLSIIDKKTTFKQAFGMADDILTSATRGISEIILKHGEIQVDFADVRAIMSQGGDALMGTGRASGENRATIAADRAIHSPLLDNVNIAGATGVLINITGGDDLGMLEINDAMNFIYEAIGTDVNSNIIFGTVTNPDFKDEISITVISTGFGQTHTPKQFGAKLTSQDQGLKRSAGFTAPTFPAQTEMRPQIVESFKDPMIEKSNPSFHERITQERNIPERNAPERISGFQDRAKPVEDSPLARPFVKPSLKGGYNPIPAIPRDDENRVLFNDSAYDAPRKYPSSSIPSASGPISGSSLGGNMGGNNPGNNSGANTGANAGNGLSFGMTGAQSQKGRYKDLDPDIDYETPAFLRNQAD